MRYRRNATRRNNVQRPSREWVSLTAGWSIVTATSTQAVALMSLQAPTSLNLTSDPPEDLTVLRVVGMFGVTLSALSSWTMALIVQDTAWTPTALFADDSDKRILWSRTFEAISATTGWRPPGVYSVGGTDAGVFPMETITVDIAPKVRMEAGKALYLVAYETTGAASFTTASTNMRLLFQRSGRR